MPHTKPSILIVILKTVDIDLRTAQRTAEIKSGIHSRTADRLKTNRRKAKSIEPAPLLGDCDQ